MSIYGRKRFVLQNKSYIEFLNFEKEKSIFYYVDISNFIFKKKLKKSNNLKTIIIKLDKSEADFIIIPNREGERIYLKQNENLLFNFSKENNLNIEFVKIIYPSIASTNFISFKLNKKNYFLYSPPNLDFLITDYIYKEDNEHVYLEINSCEQNWFFFSINETNQNFRNNKIQNKVTNHKNINKYYYENDYFVYYVVQKIFNKINRKSKVKLKKSYINARYFIQIGFISPQHFYYKKNRKGFLVLEDIARLVYNNLGDNNIIHLFGYSKGHDIDYPDYTPSNLLGGINRLKQAVKKVHNYKQKVSIYLNARIASKILVDKNKKLRKAIYLKKDKKPVVEKYNGREFYVMDPDSKIWIKTLYKWVKKFKKLKIDGIQLDQIGGREALGLPCQRWGKGYYKLIKLIQKKKMFVWIQGCSNLYPADIYELTYRNPKVLKNGIIRGGTPLGEPDFIPIILTNNKKTFLIPISKLKFLPSQFKLNYITDLEYKKGELFIYNENYSNNLKDAIQRIKM